MFLPFFLLLLSYANFYSGFPGGISGKEPNCQCKRHTEHGFSPWAGKIPWRREQLPTPVFLLREFHGQRSLVGYCPWGRRIRQDRSDLACMHNSYSSLKIQIKHKFCEILLESLCTNTVPCIYLFLPYFFLCVYLHHQTLNFPMARAT